MAHWLSGASTTGTLSHICFLIDIYAYSMREMAYKVYTSIALECAYKKLCTTSSSGLIEFDQHMFQLQLHKLLLSVFTVCSFWILSL